MTFTANRSIELLYRHFIQTSLSIFLARRLVYSAKFVYRHSVSKHINLFSFSFCFRHFQQLIIDRLNSPLNNLTKWAEVEILLTLRWQVKKDDLILIHPIQISPIKMLSSITLLIGISVALTAWQPSSTASMALQPPFSAITSEMVNCASSAGKVSPKTAFS